MIFSSQRFLQKKSKRILLYNYETSGRLVFFLFLEEIEGTKKTFRNYLTFSSVFFIHNGIFLKASLLCNSVIFVSMQSVCNISSKKKLKNERSVRSAMGQIFSNDWDNCFLSCYQYFSSAMLGHTVQIQKQLQQKIVHL